SRGKTETVISKRDEDIRNKRSRIGKHVQRQVNVVATGLRPVPVPPLLRSRYKTAHRAVATGLSSWRRYDCRAGAPPARQPIRLRSTTARQVRLPYKRDTAGSKNVKSSHQFLARFHRLCWVHAAEQLFAAFAIHCSEFAHELIARFPFRIFACANAQREQRGDDPNGDVG